MKRPATARVKPASQSEKLIEAPLGLRLALSPIEDHPGPAYAHRRANIGYTAATRLLRELTDSDPDGDGASDVGGDPWEAIGHEIDRATASMYAGHGDIRGGDGDAIHSDFLTSAALLLGFAMCWITMAHASGQSSALIVGGAR